MQTRRRHRMCVPGITVRSWNKNTHVALYSITCTLNVIWPFISCGCQSVHPRFRLLSHWIFSEILWKWQWQWQCTCVLLCTDYYYYYWFIIIVCFLCFYCVNKSAQVRVSYPSSSAMKMIRLSRTAAANTTSTSSSVRQLKSVAKFTCSSQESNGRVRLMI